MPSNGVRTLELPPSDLMDEVLGNRDGQTSKQSIENFAGQLTDSGLVERASFKTVEDFEASIQPSRGLGARIKIDGLIVEEVAPDATNYYTQNAAPVPVRVRIVSTFGTTRRYARAAGDDSVEINRILADMAKDRASAIQQAPETQVLDFGGQIARLANTLIVPTGVYLHRPNFRAIADMPYMVATEFYDDFLTARAAGQDTTLLQEYHMGFAGVGNVSAAGYNMTSGVIMALASDWMQTGNLTIVGEDTENDILDGVLGYHIANEHTQAQPRTFFAESEVQKLKVARCFQGVLLDGPDAIYDKIEAQSCPDFGINQKQASSVRHAHVYGCADSFWPNATNPRGYGYYFGGSFMSPVGDPYIIAETCDHGVVFGLDAGNMRPGSMEIFTFKNLKSDVTAVTGATGINANFSIKSGSENANFPRNGGIVLPSGAFFSRSQIELKGYIGALNFEARESRITGQCVINHATDDFTSGGTKQTPQIEAQNSKIDLIVQPPFNSTGEQDFILSGAVMDASLILTNNGTSGEPNVILGASGGTAITNSKVTMRGNFTWEFGNRGVGNDITDGSSGNNGRDESLTISGGVIDLTDARNQGLGRSFQLDTEASASADDLDTINGGHEGRIITLMSTNNGRDVTLKHGTGNIVLNGASDRVLSNRRDRITLQWDRAESVWVEISYSQNST